jgi:phosphatidate cytidylyltransferase
LNNFFRRTLTGAWIVVFILGGFWLHPITFLLTGLVLLSATQYEYYVLIRNRGIPARIIGGLLTGAVLYTVSALVASGFAGVSAYLAVIPFPIVVMILELYRNDGKPFDSLAHTFFPLIYIVLPFSLFPYSAFSHEGMNSLLSHGTMVFSPGIVIGFFLLIWANDTGAYLIGITVGKHRLMESISPKKTWEGFFGGMVLAAAAAWLLSGWLGVVSSAGWTGIAIIVSITGTYGDLIESMLKRSTGVKDSGNIMPGHGGFLDRFDSSIISFPLVYLFISLLV